MKILMLESRLGAANALGSRTRLYRRGEAYDLPSEWGVALAESFVAAGWAKPYGEAGPASTKPKPPVRQPARRRPRRPSSRTRGRLARR